MGIAERHEEVTALFLTACDLAPEKRAAFLGKRCDGDSELRAEVEAMLRADDGEPSFLVSPVGGADSQRLVSETWSVDAETNGRADVPAHVGRYKVLAELGRGGTAIVYLAEQENPARRVAVKVLRPGITSRGAFQRLEQEARILARLQHSGIAQIFEAGVVDSSGNRSPFFAMEFVDGQPLGDFAQARSLGTHERLELMLQVCDAVEHAHQRGIIHRDLKPSNILVDQSGNPKVLDFGIARATDCDVHATTLRTDIGQLIGTIPYMSPEQTLGDPDALDTRSDVYSLGVVSYELLLGRLPHDLDRKLIHEAIRIIREEDPERPSATSAALRGDIETILLKALEKDRDRRYQTVSEFAADIHRYLNDQPILARPASAAYQLRKFARRNKGFAAGVLVAIFAVLGGAVLAAWQAVRATRERDRAERSERTALAEAKRATQAEGTTQQEMEFLTNLLVQASSDQADFRNVTVRQAVDRAAQQLDQGPELNADLERGIRHTLGSTYVSLWEYDSAEKNLLREREILKSLGSSDALALADNSRLLTQVLLQTGRALDAKPFIDEALAIFRRTRGEDDLDTLGIQSQLARYYAAADDDDACARTWHEVLDTVRRIRGETHPLAIEAKAYLGLHHKGKGQLAEAELLLQEVLQARMETLGHNHVQTLTAMNNLAMVQLAKGDAVAAIDLLTESLEGHRQAWGPSHHETYVCQINLLDASRSAKRWEEVERLARDALPRRDEALRPDETVLSLKPVVALAQALNALNRPSEAIEWYDEALLHPFFQQDVHQAARVRAVRGQCLAALDRFSEAEQDLLGARETLDQESPRDVEFLGRLLTWLIDAYDHSGRAEEAEAFRAARISLSSSPPSPK